MITSSKQMQWEIIWWMVILALAALVALAMTTTPLYGQTIDKTGDRPAAMYELSMAVSSYRAHEFEHARWHLARAESLLPTGMERPSVEVWQILTAQARGDVPATIHGWKGAVLEPTCEVWRHVGMASTLLRADRLEQAEKALDQAAELDPNNPVAYYVSGLVNLEQSRRALEYLDAVGPTWFKLAGYHRPPVLPNSRAMYQLAAMHDLERAIEEADYVYPHVSLTPSYGTLPETMQPTVADLLVAMGAENFVAESHNMLGTMYLKADQEELAEQHMDAAAGMGVRVLYGYADLAESYARQDRPADAARAYGKAFRQDPERPTYGIKALLFGGRAFRHSLLR